MYQENNHRKWQSPPANPNPPLDNLKIFLQKRIRAIMAKEWWDFIVNVNTLNSDHASLLYSLANLCPSFNYFLQTKDKELQLIIKKRPQVKPRIFSGSERTEATPEPIVPRQLPLVTRRNSATELVKILNELYPNESPGKSKQPRAYGPASKQKKALQVPNKKNDTPKVKNYGHSPLLTRLLADESQKENAHTINNKKLIQSQLSMPVIIEDNNEVCKTVLSNTNYDLNQNRLNQNPRKMKKIIKVKKKRYVFSNGTGDPKKKFILEDETPHLSLKLIKKFRIKKFSINVERLKDSVLDYYAELRNRNFEKNVEMALNTVPTEEAQSNTCLVKSQGSNLHMNDQIIDSNISDQSNNSSINDESIITDINDQTGSQVKAQSTSKQINDPCTNSIINPSSQSSTLSLIPDKEDETHEKNVLQKYRKENITVLERLNSKELKNMYCHGGIVPLGKVLTSDKVTDLKNKHFLSLKEKKAKCIINDSGDNVLKTNETNSITEETDLVPNDVTNLLELAVSSELSKNESATNEISFDIITKINEHTFIDNSVSANDKVDESEASESFVSPEVPSSSENIVIETDNSNINEVVNSNTESHISEDCSKTSGNNDASEPNEAICIKSLESLNEKFECSRNKSSDKNGVIEETKFVNNLELIEKDQMSEKEQLRILNNETESIVKNSEETIINDNSKNSIESNESLFNKNGEEPLAKRPRIEINLTEMTLEITKTIVESGNTKDHTCKMCKLFFDSDESWNNHFEKNVPKCTPNLEVTWDNTELLPLSN